MTISKCIVAPTIVAGVFAAHGFAQSSLNWEQIKRKFEYSNPLLKAAFEGATRRLRPIMMTMLVATLGLLPAAMSRAIGSDSQRPFAIAIVGGLIVDLIMSTFMLPTFYVWWARHTDHPLNPDESRSVYE